MAPDTVSAGSKKKLQYARNLVADMLKKEQTRAEGYYNQKTHAKAFEVGDAVMLLAVTPPNVSVRKLYPRFVGPFRIVKIKNPVIGVVPVHNPDMAIRWIHSNRSKPCPPDIDPNFDENELLTPFADAASIDPNLEIEG
jgi:hypothetical protein